MDLSGNEPEHGEEQAERGKKPRGGDEPKGARQRRRNEGELRGRLLQVLERLAETLDGRGDGELAAAIREDKNAMAGGLVSLTRPLVWLRGPIIAALSVAEPLLAFGRVGRIVGSRFSERRAERQERRAEAQELAPEPDTPAPPWEEMSELELRAYAEAGHPNALHELARRGLELEPAPVAKPWEL